MSDNSSSSSVKTMSSSSSVWTRSSSSVDTRSSSSSSSSSTSSEILATLISVGFDGVFWERSHLIASEATAVVSGGSENKLCQTIPVETDTYAVGKVALRLRERLGTSAEDPVVVVEIWECDEDGMPSVLVAQKSKLSSDISYSGWHAFDFMIGGRASPASGILAVVFYQDGGDDDNYVAWAYAESEDLPGRAALLSGDGGASWSRHHGVSRLVRILQPCTTFDEAYSDSALHVISSAPGQIASRLFQGGSYLGTGEFHRTILAKSSAGPGASESSGSPSSSSGTGSESRGGTSSESSSADAGVVLDASRVMVGIVCDCSGSMGWNDRGKNKAAVARAIVDRIRSEYPGESIFEIVRFGSSGVGTMQTGSSAQYASIKLDADAPEDTVQNSDGSDPSMDDLIVAFGFENLEEGHSYVFAQIATDDGVLFDGSGFKDEGSGMTMPDNMQSMGSIDAPVLFSVSNAGPGSEKTPPKGSEATVAETQAGGATSVRHPLSQGRQLPTSGLAEAVVVGDTQVSVRDASPFSVGSKIDLVGPSGFSCWHQITAESGNILTISPPARSSVAAESAGGFVQQSPQGGGMRIHTRQFMMLVKDEEATRDVTFYVQTSGGGTLKWNFRAFLSWDSTVWGYIDDPLVFTAQATDADGNSLGSDASVRFYVGDPPDFADTPDEAVTVEYDTPLVLSAGSDTVVVPSTKGVGRGDSIVFISSDGVRKGGYIVDEVDEEGLTIRFTPPLLAEMDGFELASIEITPMPDSAGDGQEVFATFSAVEVTPMVIGRQMSYHARLPTDPPQVPESGSDYNAFNQDVSRWLHRTFDLPAAKAAGDLRSTASIRILPVTEDVLKNMSAKDDDLGAASNTSALSEDERQQLEALEESFRQIEGDEAAVDVPDPRLQDESSSESSGDILEGEDFKLYPAIVPVDGQASMYCFADSLEELNWNAQNLAYAPGGNGYRLAKSYPIYPVLTIGDGAGGVRARYAMQQFSASFASPVQIFSSCAADTVSYGTCCCVDDDQEEQLWSIACPGVKASSGQSFSIDYMVYVRGSPMRSGVLKVKIFDTNRAAAQMSDPMSVVPNLKDGMCALLPSCQPCKVDTYSPEDDQHSFYKYVPDSSYHVDSDAYGWQEATYLSGYDKGGWEIPVVDGRAQIVIPATNVVAKLRIVAEAKYPQDNRMSCVKDDVCFMANPIEMTVLLPSVAESGLDQPTIAGSVVATYLGSPVPDNTLIELNGSSHKRNLGGQAGAIDPSSPLGQQLREVQSTLKEAGNTAAANSMENMFASAGNWPATTVSPNVAKTIGGVASGMSVGPHGEVIMVQNRITGEWTGDEENFLASALVRLPSGLTYPVEEKTSIEWISERRSLGDEYFVRVGFYSGGTYVGTSTSVYADGWSSIVAVADIPQSVNSLFPLLSEDPTYVSSLLGADREPPMQGVGRPAIFSASRSKCLPLPGQKSIWYPTKPADPSSGTLLGEDGDDPSVVGWAAASISNCATIVPEECDPENPCCWPCEQITFLASGKSSEGKFVTIRGCAATSATNCIIAQPDGSELYNLPTITWRNPLEGELTLLGGTGDIVRDGVSRTQVDFDVTFSGRPIPMVALEHNVKDKDGNPLGFPVVQFDVYYLDQTWDSDGNLTSSKEAHRPDLTLSSYSAVVSLSKTSADEGHYHRCSVDDGGAGTTTSTHDSATDEEISGHAHEVFAYQVVPTADEEGVVHNHSLRSVATTYVNPVSNKTKNLCVTARVSYDASKTSIDRLCTDEVCTSLESLDIWKLAFDQEKLFHFASQDVMNSDSGITVTTRLSHMVSGEEVEVPDGKRIHFSFRAYKRENQMDDGKTVNFGFGNDTRPYMDVEIEARCTPEPGRTVTATTRMGIYSNLTWYPDCRSLTQGPTADDLYISSALNNIHSVMGSSPVSDAVFLAADRMNSHQILNPEWRDAEKILFLISDCGEGEAEKSLSQAISRINCLSSDIRSPAVVFLMGDPHPADSFYAERLASETGGSTRLLPVGFPGSAVEQEVSGAFTGAYASFNNGTYSNIVDLGASYNHGSADVSISVPAGSSAKIQFRFSDDGENWGAWSSQSTLLEDGTVPIPGERSRYMQYKISMTGSPAFESPRFLGIRERYVKSGETVLYFQPIDLGTNADEYVGEILVSHEGSIPDASSVTYGVCHYDTLDAAAYDTDPQPAFESFKRRIILSRYCESTTSRDMRTFSLVNGSWPEEADIEVLKVPPGYRNASTLDPSSYSANAKAGTVTTLATQEEGSRILVTVNVHPVLRVVCRIVNGSEEAASLDHIGISYSTSKRYGVLPDGTIVKRALVDVVDESSSSESSESNGSQ